MKVTVGPDLHGPATELLAGARFERVSSGRRAQVWRATFDDDRADLAVKMPTTAVGSDPTGTGPGSGASADAAG